MSLVNQDTSSKLGGDVVSACRRLHAAIDALDQAAADMLDVSRSDLRCLNLLEHGPLTPKRIGWALVLTSGSVTALVDRLERKGLVERARDASDRRGVLVSATPKAFATVGALYRSCAETLRATVLAYPEDERMFAVKHLFDAASAWERALPAT